MLHGFKIMIADLSYFIYTICLTFVGHCMPFLTVDLTKLAPSAEGRAIIIFYLQCLVYIGAVISAIYGVKKYYKKNERKAEK